MSERGNDAGCCTACGGIRYYGGHCFSCGAGSSYNGNAAPLDGSRGLDVLIRDTLYSTRLREGFELLYEEDGEFEKGATGIYEGPSLPHNVPTSCTIECSVCGKQVKLRQTGCPYKHKQRNEQPCWGADLNWIWHKANRKAKKTQ